LLSFNPLWLLSFNPLRCPLRDHSAADKHVAHGNYPSSAFVLAGTVAHIPVSVFTTLIYIGILYSMAGLTAGAGHFFFAVLVGFLTDLIFRNLMAAFSFAGRTLQAAQAMPMPLIALLILFAGFLVTPNNMGAFARPQEARVASSRCASEW
jgi:hypothetical protein